MTLRIFISFILLAALTLWSGGTSALQRKVLFLGNSYTYVNNLPQIIYDIAISLNDTLIFDSQTPGGYTLEQHSADSISTNKIRLGGWDFVVMQEQSQLPAFIEYLSSGPYNLSHLIKEFNPCARKMYYMTWGRKNGDATNCAAWPPVCTYEGMDSLLRLRYIETAINTKADLSPVGAVWNYIRTHHPLIELYQADGSHPSVAGSYAAACSFYAALFKKDPSLSSFNYSLDPSVAAVIRNAAKLVVYDSLSNWEYGDYIPQADFNYSIGNGTNEVHFNNLSENADGSYWDFGDGNFSSLEFPIHNYLNDGNYTITLNAYNCDLHDTNYDYRSLSVNFCPHTPLIVPDSLFFCPDETDTLWTQNFDSYQWLDEAGNAIAGETNRYFVPAPWSSYSVLTTSNGCTELSAPAQVWSLSTGLVIFRVDSTSDSAHPDTLCAGDTVILYLRTNKPSGNVFLYQWYRDGLILTGDTLDSLVINSSGHYSIRVINNLCPAYLIYENTDYNLHFLNCNTSIPGIDEMSGIRVYPNPFSSVLRITGNRRLHPGYSLYDTQGRMVQSGTLMKDGILRPPDDLSPGVYFLSIDEPGSIPLRLVRSPAP
jgi:hypothetical protein